MSFSDLVSNIQHLNWINPTWDVFLLVFFVLASLLYGVSLGRDRIMVILVAVYMSLAVVTYVPFIREFNAKVAINETVAFKVSIFLGIFILLFFFLSHSALLKTFGSSSEQGKMWQILMLSFLQTGLLISVTLSFLPQENAQWLSELSRALFLSDAARAVWMIGPIVGMGIIGRSKEVV
ncbi:hypothetical protein HYV73_03110 [Candidatus Uhrbacteria bacterium]|nr:hypothetical protein [Candidatus Uhrbacteria bacterium]